jgi:hypothetical protein
MLNVNISCSACEKNGKLAFMLLIYAKGLPRNLISPADLLCVVVNYVYLLVFPKLASF